MSQKHAAASFAELPLSPPTLATLDRLGLVVPTPIQAGAIAPGVEGKDVLGLAQTGTGKTLAFGLPILERVKKHNERAVVIVPTRELAIQVEETLRKLHLRCALIIGGAPMDRQIGMLRAKPEVVVGTPGRLQDHLNQRSLRLDSMDIVVLDEADRMFDMGFAPAIKLLLACTPEDRQTLLFSATMPPEIADLAHATQRNPVRIEVNPVGSTTELVSQEMIFVPKENRGPVLQALLDESSGPVLVFVRTRHGARKVAKTVRGMGHTGVEIHADRTLAQRRNAMEAFRNGDARVLVATDIAARGIDVKDIELVINFDMPDQLDDYIHRIGRTGRAGSTGRSVTLATPQQKREVAMLEKMIKMEIPRSGLDLQKLEPLRVDPRAADREIAPRRHAETANHQQHRDFRATDSRRGPRPERRGNDRGPRPERTTYERAPRPERQDVQPKPEVRPPDFAQPLEAPKDFTPRGTRGGRGGGKKPAFDSNWTAPPSEGAGRAERPQADRAPRQDRPWADRRPNGDRPTGPRPPADSRVPKPGPAGPPSAKHRKGGASAPKRAGFAKPDAAGNPFGKFFGKKGAKKRA